ncbi:MAG TPA: NAD-dependent epimerase/dehydratase family protein [Gemmatimonadales bacterium]|nr:NAD-dependent epimerase/dehydratase family protein [Gemmatimonadales bacterium]
MDVVITGGSGFVGAHLVRRLLERGHRVTSLDKSAGLFDDELRSKGATLLSGSVTEVDDVARAMAGAELVYHLASPFGDILQPDSAYWDIEVNGTRNVLEAARRGGVRRVVHCSTQGVHGIITRPPGNEDSPIAPRDYYCYSKAEGEKVCREFIAKGMDIVIVRPTSVYGPGDTRGWLKLYRMVSKGWFLMIGSGKTLNHPVYVENLVDLFELCGTSPAAKGRTYLAGDEEAVTLNELVRAVGAAVGTNVRIIRFPWYDAAWFAAAAVESVFKTLRIRPPVFRRRLSWFRTNRAFQIDRAKAELGYTPRVRLSEGLSRTAYWYRKAGYLSVASQVVAWVG